MSALRPWRVGAKRRVIGQTTLRCDAERVAQAKRRRSETDCVYRVTTAVCSARVTLRFSPNGFGDFNDVLCGQRAA